MNNNEVREFSREYILELHKSVVSRSPPSSGSSANGSRGGKRKRGSDDGAVPAKPLKIRSQHDNSVAESLAELGLSTVVRPTQVQGEKSQALEELRRLIRGDLVSQPVTPQQSKYISLDCEMVGLGPNGGQSSLARVSVVNYHGAILLDTFVAQTQTVTDHRTKWSGVRAADLVNAPSFKTVQKQVADLMKDRILVGHALPNDYRVLKLSHPPEFTRDTRFYRPLRDVAQARSLKVLVRVELGVDIQWGEHSSVVDARATLALFRLHEREWERSLPPSHQWHALPDTPDNDDQSALSRVYSIGRPVLGNAGLISYSSDASSSKRPALHHSHSSASTDAEDPPTFPASAHPAKLLSGLSIHLIPAKLTPSDVAGLIPLAESHGATLSASPIKADIVLTTVGARKRLERHIDWEEGSRRWILRVQWLEDSVRDGVLKPFDDYLAVPPLKPA